MLTIEESKKMACPFITLHNSQFNKIGEWKTTASACINVLCMAWHSEELIWWNTDYEGAIPKEDNLRYIDVCKSRGYCKRLEQC